MCLLIIGINTQHIFTIRSNPTLETRAVFWDISKAFDKVLHERLIFKLKSVRIAGSLIKLMKSYYRRTDAYKNLFFPNVVNEWNKLKSEIRNSDSWIKFKKCILNFESTF